MHTEGDTGSCRRAPREYGLSRLVDVKKIDGAWLISDVRESSLRPRSDADD